MVWQLKMPASHFATLGHAPGALLLIQLLVNVLRNALEEHPSVWIHAPMWEIQQKSLASARPSHGHCSLVRNEAAHGRSLSASNSSSVTVPFKSTLTNSLVFNFSLA